jgi:hypothetical protein
MRKVIGLCFVLILSLALPWMALAQEGGDTVTVPDVTGLNVPQAAAELNRAGLRLGAQDASAWAEDSGVPPNTVVEQAIAAGESVAWGTAVDVAVLRSPNALLIYDDNDITLVNQTGGQLNLNGLVFNSLEGDTGTSFSGGRWQPVLDDGHCTQLWSIAVREAKRLAECGATRWLTTNNPAEHFWTARNNAPSFQILQDGIQRAVCPTSPDPSEKRCEFFLASGGTTEITDFVYFAYTTDRFSVINRSDDAWMALPGLAIIEATGGRFALTDPATYDNPDDLLGDLARLAPGQCLLLRNQTDEGPPQDCDPLLEMTYDVPFVFWMDEFRITSLTDGEQRSCPGADSERLTVCILPR